MKTSAGLLVYRIRSKRLEVFIAHMGGPLWAKKEKRAWSIPKGEVDPGEQPLAAALREFNEETGMTPPASELIDLGEFRQSAKKRILIWACEGDLDAEQLISINFSMEWPPGSGKKQEFPEVDRGEWFTVKNASDRVIKGQVQVLEALAEHLVD
ncbi:MAG: NUDIX domain-containing protein [Solirubrobacterales bacterium]